MSVEFDTTALGFSIQNAFFLARACEAAYARDEERLREAAGELGLAELLRPFQVLVPEEGTDLRGFVAANEEMVALIFRGAESLQEYLRDEAILQKPGFGGLVHKGFADAFATLWPEAEGSLAELLSGRDLWVAGHDLGGALAVLAAARLHEQGTNVEAVYTFGAPRVGNPAFFAVYQPITYRLVNNNDILAHVPAEVVPVWGYHYYSYKHVGTLKYFDRHGLLGEGSSDWTLKKQAVREQLLRLGQPPTQWFQDHHLSSYLTAIETNL
jgi:triacylglycerol lipase